MEESRQRTEKAWLLRFDQKNDEAYELFVTLKADFCLPAKVQDFHTSLSASQNPAREEITLAADLFLLEASIFRSQGRNDESRQRLSQVQDLLKNHNIFRHDLLSFEQGLNYLSRGEHFAALDAFTLAKIHARTAWLQSAALMNAILCQENLRLSTSHNIKELQNLLALKHLQLDGVQEQLTAFWAREAFRGGDISKALQFYEKGCHPTELTQSEYCKSWLLLLPFHRRHLALAQIDAAVLLSSSDRFYHGAYRARTLCGVVHPDDFKEVRLNEVIERIYLWTWQWLENSKVFPVQRVLSLLKNIHFEDAAHRLTQQDSQLLRNSLLWLSLFGFNQASELTPLLARLQLRPVNDDLLFEYERLFIDYMFAIRDRKRQSEIEIRELLYIHAVTKIGDVNFLSLSNEWPSFRQLRARDSDGTPARAPLFTIDLANWQIQNSQRTSRTHSQSMCQALEIFRKRSTVSLVDFARLCFGFYRFDDLVHGRAIFNLLGRMRKIFGSSLNLRVKMGRIIAEAEWQDFQFIEMSDHTQQILQAHEWNEIIRQPTREPREASERAESATALLLTDKSKSISTGKWVSRQYIQNWMQRPRSSVNRRITSLLKAGLIKKTGSARATRYLLSPQAEKVLMHERKSKEN